MAQIPLDDVTPEWKARLLSLKNRSSNTALDHNLQFQYTGGEKGFRNESTNSHVKISNNGNVEMFAGDDAGIIVNDKYDTVSAFGYGVNVHSQYLNISTTPSGLRWNGYIYNPQLYQLLDQDLLLDASVRYWVEATKDKPAHWERKSITLKPFIEVSGNDEFAGILNELGIPI